MKSRRRTSSRRREPSWTPVAQTVFAILPEDVLVHYSRTRRFPEQRCVALFKDVFSQSTPNLLDVGCGTGRLAIPLAAAFESLAVLGIDVSAAAVRLAKRRARIASIDRSRLAFQTTEVLNFAAQRVAEDRSFAYILCHWCFHCVRPWRSVVLACVRCSDTSNNPRLLWLEEESDLYRALDDLGPVKSSDKSWTAFWRRYRTLCARIEPRARPEHRTGTLLRCTPELKSVLLPLGWNVDDNSQHIEEWTEPWKYRDLVDQCLAPRAFTNLQRLDHLAHHRAVAALRRALGRGSMPHPDAEVDVAYSARVVTAYPGTPAPSMEDARQSISGICAEIAEEVLELTLLARSDKSAIRVLRAVLASFFAVLFEPSAAPRWQAFWNVRSDASAADNRPLWVWIRFLAGSKVRFAQFLRDRLWASSAQPRLFDTVLGSYFRSRATLAHLAFSRTRNRARPLVMRVDESRSAEKFDVPDSGTHVEILVPKAFVTGAHAYCADARLEVFDEASWKQNSRDHLDALFSRDPSDDQKRIQESLVEFCHRLDSVLGVSAYGRDARRFVSVVQAARLFPGDVYCFFPVRDAHGNLVSSVSMGLRRMPTNEQMTVLRDCIDRLLKVPSLILSPSTGSKACNSHA